MEKEKFEKLTTEMLQILNKCYSEMDAAVLLAMAAAAVAIKCHDEVRQQIAYLIYIQMRIERVIQKMRIEGGEDCDAKGVVASDIPGGGGEC